MAALAVVEAGQAPTASEQQDKATQAALVAVAGMLAVAVVPVASEKPDLPQGVTAARRSSLLFPAARLTTLVVAVAARFRLLLALAAGHLEATARQMQALLKTGKPVQAAAAAAVASSQELVATVAAAS